MNETLYFERQFYVSTVAKQTIGRKLNEKNNVTIFAWPEKNLDCSPERGFNYPKRKKAVFHSPFLCVTHAYTRTQSHTDIISCWLIVFPVRRALVN